MTRYSGFCIGETLVDDKSNEIKAIPEFLKQLNIKDTIKMSLLISCLARQQTDYSSNIVGISLIKRGLSFQRI
jgi:hypothetical protein